MTEPRRVYVDMVGDLFHAGHVELLRAARELGDHLVVGVLSDETVAAYKRTPITTLAERVAVIEACRYVDEVIPDAPDRPSAEFLDEHRISLVVHGDDVDAVTAAEVYGPAVETDRLHLVPRIGSISTTELIARVRSRTADVVLAVVLGRPGTGKTTLARRISAQLSAAYVRIDAIGGPMFRAGLGDHESVVVGVSYDVAHEMASENLSSGRAVVVDGVHATHGQRESWRSVAESAGVRLRFFETVLADEVEHRRRVEQRSAGPSGYLGPRWHEIEAMPYDPWDEPRCGWRTIVEMADADQACVQALKQLDR